MSATVNEQIRRSLLASRDANRCRLCSVITQNGLLGLRLHVQICHPESGWRP